MPADHRCSVPALPQRRLHASSALFQCCLGILRPFDVALAGTVARMGLFSKKKAADAGAADVASADFATDAATDRMTSGGGGLSTASDKNPFVAPRKLLVMVAVLGQTSPP